MVIWHGGFFKKYLKQNILYVRISMRNISLLFFFFLLERHFSNIPIFLRMQRCRRITLFHDILHTFDSDVSQLLSYTAIRISLAMRFRSLIAHEQNIFVGSPHLPPVRSRAVKEYCRGLARSINPKQRAAGKGIFTITVVCSRNVTSRD